MPRAEQRKQGWSGGDPADLTAWTLVRAYHSIARTFYSVLGQHGLTPQQFGVLLQLAHEPGVSQAALARTVLVTPQSMGQMLQQLVEVGWVERTNVGRGRPTAIAITTTGRAILDRATPDLLDAVRPPALGLTEAQDRTLNRLLTKLTPPT